MISLQRPAKTVPAAFSDAERQARPGPGRLFRRFPAATAGLCLLLGFVALAVFAPWIVPYDPFDQDLASRFQPPSEAHWFGTDGYGRDLLSRVIWGSRASLMIGLFSVLSSFVVGTAMGLAAAYWGGRIDDVLMRLLDMLMALPAVIVGIMVVVALGSSTVNLTIAISLALIPSCARMAKGPAQVVKEREFVIAATALGASDLRIITRHVLPLILGPVVVMVTLNFARAILVEAALSYLGLGVRPPTPSWGSIIRDGTQFFAVAPWMSALPGLAILGLVVSLNLIGDSVHDYVDPRIKREVLR